MTLMIESRLAKISDAPGLRILNDLFNGDGCNSAENIAESLQNNTQEIVCIAADENNLLWYRCAQILKSMWYCFLISNGVLGL